MNYGLAKEGTFVYNAYGWLRPEHPHETAHCVEKRKKGNAKFLVDKAIGKSENSIWIHLNENRYLSFFKKIGFEQVEYNNRLLKKQKKEEKENVI